MRLILFSRNRTTCIVHQIRNSIKYVSSKNQIEFLKGLKTVYKVVNQGTGEENLMRLEEMWGEQYPIVIKSWQDNWFKLAAFFDFTAGIHRLIYTTNTV